MNSKSTTGIFIACILVIYLCPLGYPDPESDEPPTPSVCEEAKKNPEAVQRLFNQVSTYPVEQQGMAIECLAQIGGTKVIPQLTNAATGSNSGVRYAAVQALSRMKDPRVAAIIGDAFDRETDITFRYYMLPFLTAHSDSHTFDRLVHALHDPAMQVRLMTPNALAATKDPRAVAALEEASKTETDPAVRQNIGAALLSLRGHQDIEALLKTLKDDPSASVRVATVGQVANSHDPRAVPALIERIEKDSDPSVRAQAAWMFANSPDPRALSALLPCLKTDTDPGVRGRVLQALGALKEPKAETTIIKVLESDSNKGTRVWAIEALGLIAKPSSIPALQKVLLTDKERSVRRFAAEALGRIPDPKSHSALQKAATDDPDQSVRYTAKKALALMSLHRPSQPHPAELSKVCNHIKEYFGSKATMSNGSISDNFGGHWPGCSITAEDAGGEQIVRELEKDGWQRFQQADGPEGGSCTVYREPITCFISWHGTTEVGCTDRATIGKTLRDL